MDQIRHTPESSSLLKLLNKFDNGNLFLPPKKTLRFLVQNLSILEVSACRLTRCPPKCLQQMSQRPMAARALPRTCHPIQIYQLRLTNCLDGGYMDIECTILPTSASRKKMQQGEDHEIDMPGCLIPQLTLAKKKKKKEEQTHFPPNR